MQIDPVERMKVDEGTAKYLAENKAEGFFDKHRHTLIMVLGCMLPLVMLGALWVAGVSQNILAFGILLLCPAMHFLMMKNMNHNTQKT